MFFAEKFLFNMHNVFIDTYKDLAFVCSFNFFLVSWDYGIGLPAYLCFYAFFNMVEFRTH